MTDGRLRAAQRRRRAETAPSPVDALAAEWPTLPDEDRAFVEEFLEDEAATEEFAGTADAAKRAHALRSAIAVLALAEKGPR